MLEKDLREDDAEVLVRAIRLMRGVLSVDANVASPEAHMAEERALKHLRQELRDVLYPKP